MDDEEAVNPEGGCVVRRLLVTLPALLINCAGTLLADVE